ncbi:uncharacterized protein [Rutidosis leptorrhynchoides]|uniref:uncharacterized protein n=1 Tax=Rutidosis leptorrhynchoides TaxID=125765 RepID=UPI003A99AF87
MSTTEMETVELDHLESGGESDDVYIICLRSVDDGDGTPIKLGCACKGQLASADKECLNPTQEASYIVKMSTTEMETVELDRLESGGESDDVCRICLGSVDDGDGTPIKLGCACKGQLASAHKECAEKWFREKGKN